MPFTIAEVTDGWHAAWIVLAAALPASCGDDTPESAVVIDGHEQMLHLLRGSRDGDPQAPTLGE
jgi:hypothetical protein